MLSRHLDWSHMEDTNMLWAIFPVVNKKNKQPKPYLKTVQSCSICLEWFNNFHYKSILSIHKRLASIFYVSAQAIAVAGGMVQGQHLEGKMPDDTSICTSGSRAFLCASVLLPCVVLVSGRSRVFSGGGHSGEQHLNVGGHPKVIKINVATSSRNMLADWITDNWRITLKSFEINYMIKKSMWSQAAICNSTNLHSNVNDPSESIHTNPWWNWTWLNANSFLLSVIPVNLY